MNQGLRVLGVCQVRELVGVVRVHGPARATLKGAVNDAHSGSWPQGWEVSRSGRPCLALTLRSGAEERRVGRAASGTGGPRRGAGRALRGQGARSPTPRPARPALLRAAARGRRAAPLWGRPPAHGGLRPGPR